MKIRILTLDDWRVWKTFRLDALKNLPISFGSSYDEEIEQPDLEFQNALIKSDIFGAFIDDVLVSCARFYSLTPVKFKHRGVIFRMYTELEFRSQNIAGKLIQTVINHAKSRVSQLHLNCVTTNFKAKTLYKKRGFKIYGTEPKGLKVKNEFFDVHLMVSDFCNIIKLY